MKKVYFWLICCIVITSCQSTKYTTNFSKIELADGIKKSAPEIELNAEEIVFNAEIEKPNLIVTNNSVAFKHREIVKLSESYSPVNISTKNNVLQNKQTEKTIKPEIKKEKSAILKKTTPNNILLGLGLILLGILLTALGYGPLFSSAVVLGTILLVVGALMFFVGFFVFVTGMRKANNG